MKLFFSDFCTRENWQTAVLYLAGEMETLGLPSPCTKVNMYKSNYVQENSCTSRGIGNYGLTILEYYYQKFAFSQLKKNLQKLYLLQCWGLKTPQKQGEALHIQIQNMIFNKREKQHLYTDLFQSISFISSY